MAEGQEKADEEGQGGEGDEEEALWAQQVAVVRHGAGGGAPLPLHWSGLRAAGKVGGQQDGEAVACTCTAMATLGPWRGTEVSREPVDLAVTADERELVDLWCCAGDGRVSMISSYDRKDM